MILLKERLNVKQYVNGKTCPWGIKLFALVPVTWAAESFWIWSFSSTETFRSLRMSSNNYNSIYIHLVTHGWFDSKSVVMASNYTSLEEPVTSKQWDTVKKEHLNITRSEFIENISQLGGMDKMDCLLTLCRTKIRYALPKWLGRELTRVNKKCLLHFFVHTFLRA